MIRILDHGSLFFFLMIALMVQSIATGSARAHAAFSKAEAELVDECEAERRNLEEPDLNTGRHTSDTEIYRLTVQPAFAPVSSIRLVLWPSGAVGVTVRIRTPRTRSADAAQEQTFTLPASEMEIIRAAFQSSGFWQLPLSEYRKGPDGVVGVPICTDGMRSWIEAVRSSKYHLVVRGCNHADIAPILIVFEQRFGARLPAATRQAIRSKIEFKH